MHVVEQAKSDTSNQLIQIHPPGVATVSSGVEYLYTYRVSSTHDLNAILFPPSSENTVGCIAVKASSSLSLHYTGDFNKFMNLYCRGIQYFKHTIQINLQSYPHPTVSDVISA